MDVGKPDFDFNSHAYISLKNKYFFHSVGKAANSTVKHFLYGAESKGTKLKYDNVHDRRASPLLSPFQLPEKILAGVMSGKDSFNFTFVRNPYSRLLSCYLDRIVPKQSAPYRELIRYLNKEIGYDFSFDEFVKAICLQSDFEQNNHWRVQYTDVMYEYVNYNFIGKQESFSEDMRCVWNNIYPKLPVPDFGSKNLSPSKTNSSQRVSEYWTDELRSLVSLRYKKDFKTFGYDY
ncbi:sulfotransferase family protein [Halomonas sp. CnH100-B]|uniref:sulfotransferase family 2 domain-containing protein n=1 Tax=Halomonadaceae TaxID=28256 RepID=UPI0020980179|nr:sulfotransferase family 2 domain-containing protein [Halomonas sp. CnH100-B]MCO7227699.1 sulfotransferase family protein [Halomonas sp. CnH100-B]